MPLKLVNHASKLLPPYPHNTYFCAGINTYSMAAIIVLTIYIVGVYVAYFQVQKWADHEVQDKDEYQMLFMLSLLSWLVYPLYVVVWIIRKEQEEWK